MRETWLRTRRNIEVDEDVNDYHELASRDHSLIRGDGSRRKGSVLEILLEDINELMALIRIRHCAGGAI